MSRKDEIERYNELHCRCPRCFNIDVEVTTRTPIYFGAYKDTINDVYCYKCKWEGKVDNLVGIDIGDLDEENE